MTREQLAERIRWPAVIWFMGFVNVVAMLPQLIQILTTQKSQDVSLVMLSIYLLVQVAFSLEGFFKRNTMLMVCLGLSACVTVVTIVATVAYR